MIFRLFYSRKLIALAFLLVFSSTLAPVAYAQLSRSERKAWKKEMRRMTPEQFKQLIEEKAYLRHLLKLQEDENSDLKTFVSKQEQEINFFKSRMEGLRLQLKSREAQLGLVTEDGEQWDSGVLFKVQIGALRPSDFSGKRDKTYHLEVEDGGSYMQYVVGNFRSYYEADALKKQMRKIGMTKAWIVPYKDGKRVPLKEVLDVVLGD